MFNISGFPSAVFEQTAEANQELVTRTGGAQNTPCGLDIRADSRSAHCCRNGQYGFNTWSPISDSLQATALLVVNLRDTNKI